MTTTIQIDGIAELQKKLNTMTQEFAGLKPGGTMYNAMKRSVYMVVFTLADYPRQSYPGDNGITFTPLSVTKNWGIPEIPGELPKVKHFQGYNDD